MSRQGQALALAVLGILTLTPLAVALPDLAHTQAPPSSSTGPSGGAVETLRDYATSAAGLPHGAAPVEPIQAPVGDVGWSSLALGALAAVGLAGAATAFLLLGGARFVTPAEVLENEVRQEIFGYLKRSVGANLKQLT